MNVLTTIFKTLSELQDAGKHFFLSEGNTSKHYPLTEHEKGLPHARVYSKHPILSDDGFGQPTTPGLRLYPSIHSV